MKKRVPSGNDRKSVMRFRDEGGLWYGLDNAAIIMPAVSNATNTSLFRISVDLVEAVKLPLLDAALARVARRFPYFVVELRRGFFWHYLVPHLAPPRVQPDSASPCQGFSIHNRGTLLFRVRARGRTIAGEFSHILTDGTGGMRFFKNLLVEYCRLLDPADAGLRPGSAAIAGDPDLYDLDAPIEAEETEDAYNRYYSGNYPFPEREQPAFHIHSALLPRGIHRVTTGIIPLADFHAKAKEYGASITELLTAIYIDALQGIWREAPPLRRRSHRLSIEVPVNMRSFLPTRTNRNFSLFVHASLDMRLGPREFSEIVAKVHHQLQHEIDIQGMARHIARNVRGGRALFIRAIPLAFKAPLMKVLYTHFGENLISGVMSNIGCVRLPESVTARVAAFGFVPAPSNYGKTKAAVLSWNGNLYLGFGSLARSRELERRFFARLQSLGVPVRVECNLEE
jgi:hypothetical protein